MGNEKEIIESKNGNYEVIRKLGEGFTGEVYVVNDLTRGEPCALKLLNPEAFKEGQLTAFKREFMLLSDLHNPHVCAVYDFGFSSNKDRYFFTMEVVQGKDLYKYVEGLAIDEIEELFVQIVDGLGVIHQAGLIHYDIKGSNILVTNTPTGGVLAKIVDFGLAAPSAEVHENIAGTVRYMSPEMILHDQTIDYRSDLYSLGIVFYRMLAGDYPSQGTNMKEVLSWHVSHTDLDSAPLKAKGVPDYLIEVVENLTKPIPTERFSSAAVIVRFLELHSGKKYAEVQRQLVSTLMEEGPLVARDGIMQTIRPMLHRLGEKKKFEEDDHQTLVVSGPSGSGKSRILKEAKYITQLMEVNRVIVSGDTEGQDLDAFKKFIGCEGLSDDDATKHLLERQPLCLMVDDLDKCNGQVRNFVTAFVNTLYSSRFLGKESMVYVLLSMSVDGPKAPLPVSLHLDVENRFLEPFSAEDVINYLRLAIGESNPSNKQVKDILNFSGGIPELVRIAIATLDSPGGKIEGGADKIFAEKIDKLDDAARRVLGILVLAGRPISQHHLIVLSGVIIENALSELLKDGFITFNREKESYEAASGAVASAVQAALGEEEEKDMGKSLLEHFEEYSPDDIDAITRFAKLGADPDKVPGYIIAAAEKKDSISDLEGTYKYYKDAIDVLQTGDERLPSIHRKLARQQIFIGELDEAIKHIEEATKESGENKDDLLMRSWIGRIRHKPDEALEYIQKAMKVMADGAEQVEVLKLMNEEAQCYIQMGQPDKAIEIFTKTQTEADNMAEDQRKQVANNNLGLALALKDDFDNAIEFYNKKFDFFSDDKRLAASILSQLGYVYQRGNKLTDALETCKKSWELYSEVGDTHSSMSILSNLVCICQSLARFTDALPYVTASIELASKAGSERDLANNFLNLGMLYLNLGLEDVAGRYLNEAARIFQKLKDPHMEGWVQLSMAYRYKHIHRYDEALAYLNVVIKRGADKGYADLSLWGNYEAADMLVDLGQIEKAEKYLSTLDEVWDGEENVTETTIKVELLRCKIRVGSRKDVGEPLEKRLLELADLSDNMELRELVGEVYHTLSEYYGISGDQKKSAEFVAKAKDIIDEIASSLSEEYRGSFMKQKFRQKVAEDSVKLKDVIGEIRRELGIPEKIKPSINEPSIRDDTALNAEPSGKTADLSSANLELGETSALPESESQALSREISRDLKKKKEEDK
ncbi:MAG: protein kinase [Deltaproteobacteria bacterium]|jgi:serine/threonine protein kinase/tetratricopeptide (TPR) repeat protein|nr:protein kinase [Deltaproteobacteria bacterium]